MSTIKNVIKSTLQEVKEPAPFTIDWKKIIDRWQRRFQMIIRIS